MNEFEKAVVNELSVLEPLEFYCMWIMGFHVTRLYRLIT